MGLVNKLFGVLEKEAIEGVERVGAKEAAEIVERGAPKVTRSVEQNIVNDVKAGTGEGKLNLDVLDRRNAERAVEQAKLEAEQKAAAARSERIFTDEERTSSVKGSNTPPKEPIGGGSAQEQANNAAEETASARENKKKSDIYETRKVKDKSDYAYNKDAQTANAALGLDSGVAYDKLDAKQKKIVDTFMNASGIKMGADDESKSIYNMYANDFLGNMDERKTQVADWMKKNSGRELSWGENMGYYKVPQKVAGIGGTAFLVSSMSHSKGSQSNAELYGQQSPYGHGM